MTAAEPRVTPAAPAAQDRMTWIGHAISQRPVYVAQESGSSGGEWRAALSPLEL